MHGCWKSQHEEGWRILFASSLDISASAYRTKLCSNLPRSCRCACFFTTPFRLAAIDSSVHTRAWSTASRSLKHAFLPLSVLLWTHPSFLCYFIQSGSVWSCPDDRRNHQVQGTVASRSRCERSWNSCSTLSHRNDVALALGFHQSGWQRKHKSTLRVHNTHGASIRACTGFIFRVVSGHPWPIPLTCKLLHSSFCWSMLTANTASRCKVFFPQKWLVTSAFSGFMRIYCCTAVATKCSQIFSNCCPGGCSIERGCGGTAAVSKTLQKLQGPRPASRFPVLGMMKSYNRNASCLRTLNRYKGQRL